MSESSQKGDLGSSETISENSLKDVIGNVRYKGIQKTATSFGPMTEADKKLARKM